MSLFSGNVVAQAISFLAIPVLANVYGPEAYAVFGVFIAICSTLTPSITGKYEIAGVVTETEDVAKNLFATAIWVLMASTILVYLIFPHVSNAVGLNVNTAGFEAILPLTLFFSGLNIIWLGILNRDKQYFDISLSLVVKAITTVFVSILFYSSTGINGLILGFIFGLIASNPSDRK